MSTRVSVSESNVVEVMRSKGLLFHAGIFNFLSTIAMTVVLLSLGVYRLMDWYADPLKTSLGVPCAHAAIVHLIVAAMSPGLLVSSYLSLFHDSILAARAHLLYLFLAILVSLVVSISCNQFYGIMPC